MTCSACGKEIDKSRFPSNITFCPYCGEELHDANEANVMQFCPYCGEKLIIQANFCPHCGNKLLVMGKTMSTQKVEHKDFIEHTAKPVINTLKETFGPERKMRKLYKQWVDFSNLPPEEIPEINKDLQSAKETKEKEISGNDYHDYIQ